MGAVRWLCALCLGAVSPELHNSGRSMIGSLPAVQVYRLNDQGTWNDKGEGFLTIQHLEVGLFAKLGRMEPGANGDWGGILQGRN